jgi:hypothetical protein
LSADEGYTWLVASSSSVGTFFDRIAAYENTPPLFYLLTWPFPDGDEAWVRIVSLVAGVACVAALYWAVKPLAGRRAALLAAAALAVAPYAVSFSDYARGFVLADLGLVLALGGAVRRWWWLYWAGAVVAIWSEYDASLSVAALAFAFGWREKRVLLRALAPLATLVLWVPEALRGIDAIDVTKVSPVYPGPSVASLRDLVVRLAFGEHGTAHAVGLRWLQFVVVAGLVVVAFRASPRIVWVTAAGALVLHALVAVVGPDVFAPRYLTELLPLAAAAIGIWLAGSRIPVAVPALAMAALAVAVFLQREGRELEPDYGALRAAVPTDRRVATNSAVVAFYLRDRRPRLDRPFGLGTGACASCVVVEDTRIAGGPRPGLRGERRVGPFVVGSTGL